MSDETIMRYKPGRDPKPVGRTDWKRVKAMTDDEVEAAALADPDNLPLTEEQLATARRAMPSVRGLRLHLGMTQEQFAKAYHLPIGTVRDWEQQRTRPDAPAQALLKVIEREPEVARKALVGR